MSEHKEALAKTIDDWVQKQVAKAPPLSAEQRDRIAALLFPIPIPQGVPMSTPTTTPLPEHVSGISAIGDAIPNEPIIQPKKRTRGPNKPKNGAVHSVQPDPRVMEKARELAEGLAKLIDVPAASLLQTQSDGSVLVLNNPKK